MNFFTIGLLLGTTGKMLARKRCLESIIPARLDTQKYQLKSISNSRSAEEAGAALTQDNRLNRNNKKAAVACRTTQVHH